jgi:hypothetical protein
MSLKGPVYSRPKNVKYSYDLHDKDTDFM